MTIGRRLLISLSLLLPALFLTHAAHAQGPDDLAGWQVLELGGRDEWRVTFYGSDYVGGELTYCNTRYMPDNDTIAAGPWLLWAIHNHYWRQAAELGTPLLWWWQHPGFRLYYQGIASCYPVPVTLNYARWCGCGVQLCAETAEGAWYCRELRVMDTGSSDLEIDLPDETWAAWGYPMSQGVFTATLRVLQWTQP